MGASSSEEPMIVYVESNRFGHLEIDPKSRRHDARLRREYKLTHGNLPDGDSLLYVQGEDGVESFLSMLAPRAAQAVREGYLTRCRVSEDVICAMLGIY